MGDNSNSGINREKLSEDVDSKGSLILKEQREKLLSLWNPEELKTTHNKFFVLNQIIEDSLEDGIPYQSIADWIYGKDEKGNSKLVMDENLHILYDEKPGPLSSIYKKSFYLNLFVTDVDKFKIVISERKEDSKYVLGWDHEKPNLVGKWMLASFYGPGDDEVFNTFNEAHESILNSIKAARNKREKKEK